MKLRFAAVLLLFLLSLPSCGSGEEAAPKQNSPSDRATLDISGVTQLLDLLDLIIRKNPQYKATIAWLQNRPNDEARKERELLAQRNAEDPEVKTAIDALLSSPTYKLYYKQFRNVTPEIHRQVLCALPCTAIRSPGDIASSLQELCGNRDSVRAWVTSVVSQIDLNKSHQIALQWLPPGDYTLPPIHFLYDGNGDAFACDGEIGFDLYGIIFGVRPQETRFTNLSAVGVNEIEGVLAHELHHIYAARYLYPPGREHATWRDEWKDRLIRQIVSEGVAMQCNPLQGLRRTLKEDTTIVRYWIGQLNDKLAALRTGSITEPQIEAWYDSSFQETARMLLNEYRKRVSPTADSAAYMWQHQVDRPTMVYTLGWWMVGRISEGGKNKNTVIQLLKEPEQLFGSYNSSVPAKDKGLKINY